MIDNSDMRDSLAEIIQGNLLDLLTKEAAHDIGYAHGYAKCRQKMLAENNNLRVEISRLKHAQQPVEVDGRIARLESLNRVLLDSLAMINGEIAK